MATRNPDELFMQQSLELARQGIGLASPNPCVGAVVVDERGRIVGRGFHTYDGKKHAEVLAIEEAGEKARGNTLYINLEPCSHTGRTGPCADAVIAAGLHRVVAGMRDPNPLVAGKGFDKLRDAGIEVVEGLLEPEAQKLNESFSHYIRTRMPFGVLKSAMTLDGKIGEDTVGQGPVQITGNDSLQRVHELRHECDAILVGVGTVFADNPLLTDRSGKPRRRKLMRVVLDSQLRIPIDSRLIGTCDEDVIVFCSSSNARKRDELENLGVKVEQLSPADKSPDPRQVFRRLGELDITSVLVEGGSTVNAACLQANIISKLWLFYAPKLLGGATSVPFLSAPAQMGDSIRVKNVSLHRFGDDFAVEGYLHET